MKNRKLLLGQVFAISILALFMSTIPWVPSAMAQSADTGALTGIIKDPSGSVIKGAQISVTNIATAQSRLHSSGNDGSYRIALLPPGKYSVKISMAGFQTAEFSSVTINVTETAVLNCTMKIGMPSETVNSCSRC